MFEDHPEQAWKTFLDLGQSRAVDDFDSALFRTDQTSFTQDAMMERDRRRGKIITSPAATHTFTGKQALHDRAPNRICQRMQNAIDADRGRFGMMERTGHGIDDGDSGRILQDS